MPIYEYLCNDCGVKFDVFRSMKNADEPITCKNCLGNNTKRALSVFFASSEGRSLTSNQNSCHTCSGGNCSACGQ